MSNNVSLIDGHIDGKKMSDEDIMKALEVHSNEKYDNCEGCPYLKGDFCEGFTKYSKPFRDVLDLIKRKDAEIERLQKLQKPTGAGGFRIENGKVIYYSDMLNGYRHEFKDLDEIVKELNLYMHTDYKNIELITHYKNKAETAKAEAIKELAERLKEGEVYMRVEFPDTNLGTMAYVVLSDDIDNLVKEMAGDDK